MSVSLVCICSLGSFPSICQLCPIQICLIRIVFYYYPLEASSFYDEKQDGGRSRCEGRWGGTGKGRTRQNQIQDIPCKKRIYLKNNQQTKQTNKQKTLQDTENG